MKTKILVLFTFLATLCFSQSISDFKLYPTIISNPFYMNFKVNKADSISLKIINIQGVIKNKILTKEFLEPGTYKIEFTMAEALPPGSYIANLESSDHALNSIFINEKILESTKPSDFVKIFLLDTIKVFDSVKVPVFDTTRILIVDTLNCIRTNINLGNYESMPILNNIVFHDKLTVNNTDFDILMIYDISGKFVKKVLLGSNILQLQDLKNGVYFGLFYKDGNIVNTIKMIKE